MRTSAFMRQQWRAAIAFGLVQIVQGRCASGVGWRARIHAKATVTEARSRRRTSSASIEREHGRNGDRAGPPGSSNGGVRRARVRAEAILSTWDAQPARVPQAVVRLTAIGPTRSPSPAARA
jgi:hypothetical protein